MKLVFLVLVILGFFTALTFLNTVPAKAVAPGSCTCSGGNVIVDNCPSFDPVCTGAGSCSCIQTVCGASGQYCCGQQGAPSWCNSGLICSNYKCVTESSCGANGQACCSGSSCNSGLTCQSGTCVTPPSCGNSVCESGETASSCPQDCVGTCGNGVCNSGESCSSCSQDCGVCQSCGDGTCNNGESCSSCSQDCGVCQSSNSPPNGAFETIDIANGYVAGWSFDPDASSTSNIVHIFFDGPLVGSASYGKGITADIFRQDVNNNFGISGNHGFNYRIPDQFRDGNQHSVYVWGIDTEGGTNVLLKTSPQYFSIIPTPTVSTFCENGVSKAVVSWSSANRGTQGYYVDINDDTDWSANFWNKFSSATSTTVPDGFSPAFGETKTLVLNEGQTYYTRIWYPQTNEHSPLASFVAPACNNAPIGWLDSANENNNGLINGWALDQDQGDTSITVHLYFDGPAGSGTGYNIGPTNVFRSDVNSVYAVTGNHGFSYPIPDAYKDGNAHTVYAYGIDLTDLSGAHNIELYGSPKTFTILLPPTLYSVSASPLIVSRRGVVTVTSSGSDPSGLKVQLVCGSTSGANDLCSGAGVLSNPFCTFNSGWINNVPHTIYCRLVNSNYGTSAELTTSVISKNVPLIGNYYNSQTSEKTTYAVFRQNTGTGNNQAEWYIYPSYTPVAWGWPTSIPVPGDYNGDRVKDIAIYEGGYWHVNGQSISDIGWGLPTDVPVQNDYTGDGITDIAVVRPIGAYGSMEWYVYPNQVPIYWGYSTPPYYDIPVPGDYDGDRKTDFVVWRASDGAWYQYPSQTPIATFGYGVAPYYDVPVPADYTGDGKTDVAIWRPDNGNGIGCWYVYPNGVNCYPFGLPTDVPAPGDYNGDGKAEIAVWRPDAGNGAGCWYVYPDSTTCYVYGGFVHPVYDIPVMFIPNKVVPILTSIKKASAETVKYNSLVTIISVANDPMGQQVRLLCGRMAGTSDLCVGGFAPSNPSCSFYAPWTDTNTYQIFCHVLLSYVWSRAFVILSRTPRYHIKIRFPVPQGLVSLRPVLQSLVRCRGV